LFEESSQALQVGGRIARNFANGLTIGGNVDWAAANDVTLAPFGGLNASLLLYSAEIGYRVPISPRATFFLSGGAGAAMLAIDEPPPTVAQSSTGLLIPVGGGIKIHNRAIAPSWALRFDVRDNVILLETTQGAAEEVQTEPRHNLEFSAGLSFLFGRKAQIRPTDTGPMDTDRDGVLDPADWCLNSAGVQVDARGCPVDRDADGVPNERDACIETREGLRVDDRGCPLEPEAPAEPEREAEVPARVEAEPEPAAETPARDEPAAPLDGDRDGVPDDRDLCRGTPAGIRVDERGCLPRPGVALPPPAPAKPAPAVQPPAPAERRVEERPIEAAACVDDRSWFVAKRQIEFENRRFELVGSPATVDAQYLARAGTYDGVPMFASVTDKAPYTSLWLPRCGDGGLYELYIQSGTLP
jgi:hypothetical protein